MVLNDRTYNLLGVPFTGIQFNYNDRTLACCFPLWNIKYENGVPVEYLTALKQANLMDDFSFPAIVALYQNEVTINYLQELRETELLDHISFPTAVDMYNSQK